MDECECTGDKPEDTDAHPEDTDPEPSGSEGHLFGNRLAVLSDVRPSPSLASLDLLDAAEGKRFLAALQRAVCVFLSWLTASIRESDAYQDAASKFAGTDFGRKPMAWWQQQLADASSDPNKLSAWIDSLRAQARSSDEEQNFTLRVKQSLSAISGRCQELLDNDTTKSQWQSLREGCKELLENEHLVSLGGQCQGLLESDETRRKLESLRGRCQDIIDSKSELREGRRMLQSLIDEARSLGSDPSALKRSIESVDDSSLRSLAERSSEWLESVDERSLRLWERQCNQVVTSTDDTRSALASSVREECHGLFKDPKAQQLLQQAGLEIDKEWRVHNDAVLETMRGQATTARVAARLRVAQQWTLELLGALASWAEDLERCACRIEKVAPELPLTTLSRNAMDAARADPDALQKWLLASVLVPYSEWPEERRALLTRLTCDSQCRADLFEASVEEAVECLLDRLPRIEVPKIEREWQGTEYTIDNIELRKCNVKAARVTLNLLSPKRRAPATASTAAVASDYAAPDCAESSRSGSERVALVWTERDNFVGVDEIIRVTIKDIVLKVPKLQWSFRQHKFPHMRGNGGASAVAKGLCVVATFGVSRVEVNGKLYPRLGLTSCSVVIDRLKIEIKDNSLSVLFNVIARRCQDAMREYVVKSIERGLTQGLELLMKPFNDKIEPLWPWILSAAGSTIEQLPSAEDGYEAAPASAPPSSGLGLLILMARATLPKDVEERPFCQCVSRDKNGRKKMVKETRARSDPENPKWNEVHLLPWRKGESLDFIIFGDDEDTPKQLARRSVPSNWFFPYPFEGELRLDGLPEARLQVHVAPVMQEEVHVELNQGPGETLGLSFEATTLGVASADASGLLAQRLAEQHVGCRPLGQGDFVARVKTSEGWVVGAGRASNQKRAAALEAGGVVAVVLRRVSAGGFVVQSRSQRSC